MSQFLHNKDNGDAKAVAIPLVFFQNSQAKNWAIQPCSSVSWDFNLPCATEE